jgi:hypothetical protein
MFDYIRIPAVAPTRFPFPGISSFDPENVTRAYSTSPVIHTSSSTMSLALLNSAPTANPVRLQLQPHSHSHSWGHWEGADSRPIDHYRAMQMRIGGPVLTFDDHVEGQSTLDNAETDAEAEEVGENDDIIFRSTEVSGASVPTAAPHTISLPQLIRHLSIRAREVPRAA